VNEEKPNWRATHVGVQRAADMLGVSEDALRSVISRGGIKFDPQPDRRGRMMKVLRRSDVQDLKKRMEAISATPRCY
jgi:hypothetical protein